MERGTLTGSISPEPDETRDIQDKSCGMTACHAFLQSALDPDFLAKEIAILIDLLRCQGELKFG